MSMEGVKKAAAVFALMQQTRLGLLGGDNQDIRLGQMLDAGKDAMKDIFARATSESMMVHSCKCTDYNGGQCYNCLNGYHSECSNQRKCQTENSKHLGVRIVVKGKRAKKKN